MTVPSEEVDSSEHGGPPGPVPTTCPCGMANKNMPRIIAGEEAKENEFPWAAILTWRVEGVSQFCGGSLITSAHVLTAAHCVVSKPSSSVSVILGDHDYTRESSPYRKRVDVKEIVIHEKYSLYKHYDIALLVLEQEVQLTRFISLVCLPSRLLNLDHQYLTAMGWGRVGWTDKDYPSVFLKKMRVRAVPLEECSHYASVNTTDPHQLCTYGSRKGLGQGDSGGPVVWRDPDINRYTIVGLPSFVYPFVHQNLLPDVCTDVSTLLSWIHSNLERTNPRTPACWSTRT
uniref:Venom S1 protease 10 n=1 Tax=Lethocerus distinctifemur TaxID=280095 RepID=A0A2K8JU42_9HEMI|nr:venom S1 protease 10 [Lethocerus distinctifemur]